MRHQGERVKAKTSTCEEESSSSDREQHCTKQGRFGQVTPRYFQGVSLDVFFNPHSSLSLSHAHIRTCTFLRSWIICTVGLRSISSRSVALSAAFRYDRMAAA